jgi:hypothetical protein
MMTVESRSVRPMNSLILIMDPQSTEIPEPESLSEGIVAATESCVAVGTRVAADGPTEVQMADSGDEVETPPLKVHDGKLELSSGVLVVANILGDAFFRRKIEHYPVRLRVYANHSIEPDEIVILVG